MAKKIKQEDLLPFAVFVLRAKAQYWGQVNALNASDAIERAKTVLNIPKALWGKISVEPR